MDHAETSEDEAVLESLVGHRIVGGKTIQDGALLDLDDGRMIFAYGLGVLMPEKPH